MRKKTWMTFPMCMLALALAAMTGCNKDSNGGDNLVARAENVADQWVAQDWTAMRATFDADLSNELTEDKLAQSYSQITGAMGRFVSRGKTREGTLRNKGVEYSVVDIAATFENGPMTIRVSFGKQGKIAGFYLLSPDFKTTKAAEPPAAAPSHAAPANPAMPKGDDTDRLCEFYALSVTEMAEMMDEPVKGDPRARCQSAMAARSADERQQIADCANACGEMEGVIDCFHDFGKPSFPACGGEDEEDAEHDGE